MITLLLCSLVACGGTDVLLPGTPGAARHPPSLRWAGSNAAALQAPPAGWTICWPASPLPERTAGQRRPVAGGRFAGAAGATSWPTLPSAVSRRQPVGLG
jgi:hypothetical protein